MLLLYIKIDIQSVQAFRQFMFLNRRAAEIAVKAVRKVGEWQSGRQIRRTGDGGAGGYKEKAAPESFRAAFSCYIVNWKFH